MKSADLGRLGEDLVAKMLGYRRVPASGAGWPHKEDLTRDVRIRVQHEDGSTTEGDVHHRDLAQVKTTKSRTFLLRWSTLKARAGVEGAEPKWYDVVVDGGRAYVFERRYVGSVDIGIGGDR